jgi:hypothetical protein
MLATRQERENLKESLLDLIEDEETSDTLLSLYSFHIIRETVKKPSQKRTVEDLWGMGICPS